jgi:hypothetical protein
MATPELQPLDKLTPEVCLVIEPQPSRQSPLARFLESAKKFSDLGIAIPALLYTCGFVVLGCYAEENSLGLQIFPAIQFFSAGAGFLIIFASVVLVVLFLRLALKKCFEWLNSGAKVSKFVKKALPWVLAASFAIYYISMALHLDKIHAISIGGIGFALFFSAEGWVEKMARFYLYFIGFVAGLGLLAFYAFSAYPKIPASFGGGEPRHAHLQVEMNAIPRDLAQQLVRSGQASTAGSGNLEAEVYLVTDNSIVIKIPRPATPDAIASEKKKNSAMILQLRRSDVSAIFWDSRH